MSEISIEPVESIVPVELRIESRELTLDNNVIWRTREDITLHDLMNNYMPILISNCGKDNELSDLCDLAKLFNTNRLFLWFGFNGSIVRQNGVYYVESVLYNNDNNNNNNNDNACSPLNAILYVLGKNRMRSNFINLCALHPTIDTTIMKLYATCIANIIDYSGPVLNWYAQFVNQAVEQAVEQSMDTFDFIDSSDFVDFSDLSDTEFNRCIIACALIDLNKQILIQNYLNVFILHNIDCASGTSLLISIDECVQGEESIDNVFDSESDSDYEISYVHKTLFDSDSDSESSEQV